MAYVYKSRKEACALLGITYPTLYRLAIDKEIDAIIVGKQQKYNVEKYMKKIKAGIVNKKNICYCRVSSPKQKEDLERQIKYMKDKFPTYEIISDIASGLNYNRKGLNDIIGLAIR